MCVCGGDRESPETFDNSFVLQIFLDLIPPLPKKRVRYNLSIPAHQAPGNH